MSGSHGIEPRLASDFADRVLAAVDRRLARRRRALWFAAASAIVMASAGLVQWMEGTATSPAIDPVGGQFTSSQIVTDDADQVPGESRSALSWFFPDAEPLAQFVNEDEADEKPTPLFDERS